MATHAIIFDAYGTLFDIHAPTARIAGQIGDAQIADALGRTWRDKQLQYSWLLSLMGSVKPFWDVTQDALDYALEMHGLRDQDELRTALLDLYYEIDAYEDVIPTLSVLKEKHPGLKLGILSNGSRSMLDTAVQSSGLFEIMDATLSVDDVGIFKPDGRVYALAEERFGLPASAMTFVSCNGWDAWASSDYGFQTIWLNRFKLPRERLPGQPIAEISGLDALLELVE